MNGEANLLQALGWAVLNSLWQFAFLWVIYQFIAPLFGKARSAHRGSLAASLLIAGFAWFVYTFATAFSSSPSGIISSSFALAEHNKAVETWLAIMLPSASIAYLLLLIVPSLHFAKNYRYVQVIRRYGLSKINVDWRLFVKRVSSQIGIAKPVQIWVSELVSSPVTIGFLKPVILVPLAAIINLTPQQMEAVLLHELAHIKRHDYLLNLIINFIKTILYFNPFVKSLVKTIEREREKTCDDIVLQFQYDSYDYASALLLLERSGIQQPLQLRATGTSGDLLKRVEAIMGVERKPSVSFNKLAGLLAGLLCIIGLNAVLLLSKPLNGEKNAPFSHLATSFSFFTGGINNISSVEEQVPAEIKKESFITEATQKHAEKHTEIAIPASQDYYYPSASSSYIAANYEPIVAPQLKKYQDEQVKAAVEASKKVIENAQWKMVETSIADAFSTKEKEEIKSTYQKELSSIDWKEWENNLRKAYSAVDWDVVNANLAKAVQEVRIDSLRTVYAQALTNLDKLQTTLKSQQLTGIPDTDITLNTIELARKETLKVLNKVNAVRTRKIVHL